MHETDLAPLRSTGLRLGEVLVLAMKASKHVALSLVDSKKKKDINPSLTLLASGDGLCLCLLLPCGSADGKSATTEALTRTATARRGWLMHLHQLLHLSPIIQQIDRAAAMIEQGGGGLDA